MKHNDIFIFLIGFFVVTLYSCNKGNKDENAMAPNKVTEPNQGNGNMQLEPKKENYAYLTDRVKNTLTSCKVTENHTLENCELSALNIEGYSQAIAIHNNYVFLGGVSNHFESIKSCPLSENKFPGECNTTGALFGPRFFPSSQNGYDTFISTDNPKKLEEVVTCKNDNGVYSDCQPMYYLSKRVEGIAFHDGFVYLTEFNNNEVKSCKFENTGTLTDCRLVASTGDLPSPISIAFHEEYAFVIVFGNKKEIKSCKISEAKNLEECKSVVSDLRTPVKIATHNGYVYWTNDYDFAAIMSCKIGENGTLELPCREEALGFGKPAGLTFNGNQAYVVDSAKGTVKSFKVGAKGELTLLSESKVSANSNSIYDIVIGQK